MGIYKGENRTGELITYKEENNGNKHKTELF